MTAARSAVKSLDMIIYLANNHRAVCSAISVAGFADTQVWFCNDMLPKNMSEMMAGFDLNLEPPFEYADEHGNEEAAEDPLPGGGFDLNVEPTDVMDLTVDPHPQEHNTGGFDLNLEPTDSIEEENNSSGSRRRKETSDDGRKRIYQTLLARSDNGIMGPEVIKQVAPQFGLSVRAVQKICTAAAPTYFPAHHFTVHDNNNQKPPREYHLVDGGGAANNPTMVAMSMLTREVLRRNPDFTPGKPTEYRNYLIISIGTGSPKQAKQYTAPDCAKWGLIQWIYNGGFTPIIDIFSHASSDMVDIHAEDDSLTGDTSSVDIATKENMEKLIDIGKELLKKPVARVNIDTGMYEPVAGEGSNEDALGRFAKMLSDELRLRKKNYNSY
ncbi:hypothetical protein EJB05_26675 [Eragrostis curvula]|uniref:DUF7769 domain-containing protein n=1 Tax=Eragrostis curvula TaxID=38414 RepID=A0A5J9ULD4_9POAL|nr:hypothetical protein EJB05_26675 [Eragrostis curvula]